MKQGKFLIYISLFSLMAYACNGTSKERQPTVSTEDCYRKNIQDSALMTGWYHVLDSAGGFAMLVEQADSTVYYLNPYPVVTAEDIVKMEISANKAKMPVLLMEFGGRGKTAWSEATGKAQGKYLAFVVDNKLLTVPYVNAQITTGKSLLGRVDYSVQDMEAVKKQIEDNQQ